MVRFEVDTRGKEEEVVRFRLKRLANGGIELTANRGDGPSILTITPEGRLKRTGFCEVPGIRTDADGYIILAGAS